ncbi:hypothetical protein K458DRAFT_167421 [Lentithecium fluviatile CBS 122367]|uniref:Uncharacterized protein n=1 Tax=Lentithecium fluviatile CBS 122367 TaxID=1168545 RepID=A0A6G1JBL7_9PLEO|nr:hypothetical protein K458DRAFT_167421 [Lentithecium fluviatile CBS 122367]
MRSIQQSNRTRKQKVTRRASHASQLFCRVPNSGTSAYPTYPKRLAAPSPPTQPEKLHFHIIPIHPHISDYWRCMHVILYLTFPFSFLSSFQVISKAVDPVSIPSHPIRFNVVPA